MNVPLWPRPLFKREKNELDMRFGKSQLIDLVGWKILCGEYFLYFREKDTSCSNSTKQFAKERQTVKQNKT